MKKILSIICVVLLCCVVNVHASDEDPVAACEAQSDETKVCAINENGECECININITTNNIINQDGGE